MENIILDYTHVIDVITAEGLSQLQSEVEQAFHKTLAKLRAEARRVKNIKLNVLNLFWSKLMM